MTGELLEFIVVGLVLGGVYALFSVGLTLIFGVLDVIDVAHGEFFTLGGYAAFLGVTALHLPPALGLPLAMALTGCAGLLVYPALIAPLQRRLGKRPAGPLFLVLTLGLSIAMQNGMLSVAGGEYRRVAPLMRGGLDLGFTFVSSQRLFILGTACITLTALLLFLRYHRQGVAIRAVAQNPASAQAVGISLPRIFGLTMGLGCALAGLAGALMAPLFNVYPTVGFSLTLKAFAITILGGMGSVAGALVASFLLSLTEALSVIVLPSEWVNAVAFGLMILVLMFRPSGLFGRRS